MGGAYLRGLCGSSFKRFMWDSWVGLVGGTRVGGTCGWG